MEDISCAIEDVQLKIFEINSLVKCIRDALECSFSSTEDFSYLYHVANFACQKFDNLNELYSELEAMLYRNFIITK